MEQHRTCGLSLVLSILTCLLLCSCESSSPPPASARPKPLLNHPTPSSLPRTTAPIRQTESSGHPIESEGTSALDKDIKDETEAIRQDPTNAMAYYNRAISWKAKGDLAKALQDSDEAIRLNPHFSDAYCNRGSIWQHKGELDNALKDYDEAIRLDLKHVNSYFNRGVTWRKKGDLDKAIKDSNEAIRLDPKHPVHYLERANIWMAKGDLDKSLEDYDEAIRLHPTFEPAYFNRGLAWKMKGELDNALKDFNKAIQLAPTSVSGYVQVAWLRATSTNQDYRNGKEAIEFATKACELSEWKQFGCLATLAAAYAEAGDFMKAVKWQEKVIEIVPEKDKQAESERLDLYRANKPFRMIPK